MKIWPESWNQKKKSLLWEQELEQWKEGWGWRQAVLGWRGGAQGEAFSLDLEGATQKGHESAQYH